MVEEKAGGGGREVDINGVVREKKSPQRREWRNCRRTAVLGGCVQMLLFENRRTALSHGIESSNAL